MFESYKSTFVPSLDTILLNILCMFIYNCKFLTKSVCNFATAKKMKK